MTECERLIAEGKLPPEFLQAEVRECEVPEKMKKLWALQIDLIQQVHEICQRHGLTYFASGGTAIGTVRHHGFIPWDDDVDLCLKREDYNAFIAYAKTELKEPYFLQIPSTDKHYYRPFITLRNSNATCIAKGDSRKKCNNGAQIHIFPLDGYTSCPKLRWYVRMARVKNILALNHIHYDRKTNRSFLRFLFRLASPIIFPRGLAKYYESHERICTRISQGEHSKIGYQYAHFGSRLPHYMFDKHLYDSVVWLPFEYIQMPMPAGYHEALTNEFGDYMQFPPEADRKYKHSSWEMEPDIPYKEYCSKKYGVKYPS